MDEKKLRHTLKHVVDLLVRREYAELERLTDGVRLSAGEIARAVAEYPYGASLLPASDAALDQADIVEVQDLKPTRWSVWLPLWTTQEGRSDLELQLTLIDKPGELLGVEIDGILVP